MMTNSTHYRVLMVACVLLASGCAPHTGTDKTNKAEVFFRELQEEDRRFHEGYHSRAAVKLAELGKAAIPVLIEGMKSKDSYVAKWSSSALSDIGESVIGPLKKFVESGATEMRTSALLVLYRTDLSPDTMRARIRPVFLAVLDDPDPKVRKWGVYGLGHPHLGGNETAKVLINALGDESPIVQSQAALSLRQTQDSIAGPHLIASLQHTNVQLRVAAACALGFRKDAGAIQALVSLRKDDSSLVRWNAVVSLGYLCDRDAIRHFVPFLDDFEESEHGAAAMQAAGEMGELLEIKFGGYSRQRAIKAQEWWNTEGQKLYGSERIPNKTN